MSDRYIVTELGGWLTPVTGNTRGRLPARSYHVIDTADAHRIIAIYRTEDVGGNAAAVANRFALQRERADTMAARMNARHLETIRQEVRT